MIQFNEVQAVALFANEAWRDMDVGERTMLQLFQHRLVMPFEVFHEAIQDFFNMDIPAEDLKDKPDQYRKLFLTSPCGSPLPPPTTMEILACIPKKHMHCIHNPTGAM